MFTIQNLRFQYFNIFDFHYRFLLYIVSVISLGIISVLLIKVFFKHVSKYEPSKKNPILGFLIMMEKPLKQCFYVYALFTCVESICKEIEVVFSPFVVKIEYIIIILIILFNIIGMINIFEAKLLQEKIKKRRKFDAFTLDVIFKILKACVYVIALLLILDVIGVTITGMLAFGGISGIAVGFAAKDLLANFFGTITIYFDQPFIVGEVVKLDGKSEEGTIEKIDWKMTTIRTANKTLLFIPNAKFSTISVENISRASHKLLSQELYCTYEDISQISTILPVIKNFIYSYQGIDVTQKIKIDLKEIWDKIFVLQISCFVYNPDVEWYSSFRNNFLVDIVTLLQANDLAISPLNKLSEETYVTYKNNNKNC